ncbi:UPF0489 family protein [Variovorax paradoxus]|uniref:UPF0489 family protein n=1 Tax=Variovorax paradoxus TaxID=34073 RepID=UPI003ED0A8B6
MADEIPEFFERRNVLGKDIYVVRDHHQVLAAWARIRRELPGPPNLITIDHHADVYEAFLRHASLLENLEGESEEDALASRNTMVDNIRWDSDASVFEAIAHLENDEHIDAATRSGILRMAFCIQLSDSGGHQSIEDTAYDEAKTAAWQTQSAPPTPPTGRRTYPAAENGIYTIGHDCALSCTKRSHDDQCATVQAREIIESAYLDDQLARGSEISRCVGLADLEAQPYILDIDLDVFHSRKAVTPDDPSTFDRLVRGAVAITIATEPEWVEDLWDDDEPINAAELLNMVLSQIERALAS